MTTALIVCLTVLAIAAIAAGLIHELVKDASSTRIVLTDRYASEQALDREHAAAERAGEVDAAASTGELAAAVRALQLVAERLAPAPKRLGKPTTIHTRDDVVITGVVLAEYEDRTRLGDAHFVTPTSKHAVPGGIATVLRINESWRQEHDDG